MFVNFQGRTLVFSFLNEVNAVCLIDWFAKICKVAFTPPGNSSCKGRVNGLGDSVPMWEIQDLKNALQKSVTQEQVCCYTFYIFHSHPL